MAITRRQFVTRLGALAAAVGMSQAEVSRISEAFAGNTTNFGGTLEQAAGRMDPRRGVHRLFHVAARHSRKPQRQDIRHEPHLRCCSHSGRGHRLHEHAWAEVLAHWRPRCRPWTGQHRRCGHRRHRPSVSRDRNGHGRRPCRAVARRFQGQRHQTSSFSWWRVRFSPRGLAIRARGMTHRRRPAVVLDRYDRQLRQRDPGRRLRARHDGDRRAALARRPAASRSSRSASVPATAGTRAASRRSLPLLPGPGAGGFDPTMSQTGARGVKKYFEDISTPPRPRRSSTCPDVPRTRGGSC